MKAEGTRRSRPPARMRSYNHNLSWPMAPLCLAGVVEMTRFAIRFSWLRLVLGAVRKSWLDMFAELDRAMLRVSRGCNLQADLNILAAIVYLKG